jgi:D-alanine-D-alanine ligase
MKIAFTYNLQVNKSEQQAEFDTPETVYFIENSIKNLGHQVEQVEVSGSFSNIVNRLEALKPDLIFNTAEGHKGKYREAFYPSLFEQLDIPSTGSDAYVCNVTLDKRLCKVLLEKFNIRTPKWGYVESMKDTEMLKSLRYPLIAKPNFEGSSKGITQKSIIKHMGEMEEKIEHLLKNYPNGILVEEFIEGRDVVVGYLEAFKNNSGVLPPCVYVFDETVIPKREFNIYDFELKNTYSHGVSVEVLKDAPKKVFEDLNLFSKKIVTHLGIRDLGRIDYRITPQGEVYFLEINALPSLEPGAGIYVSAMAAGVKSEDEVIKLVIESAVKRYNLSTRPKKVAPKKIKVGLTYNLKRINPLETGLDDEAEFDSQKTIDSIAEAITELGYDVELLEATADLAQKLSTTPVDVVFNIAEGIRGRNRESQVPAILELLDIPYTGSDPTTLSLTLDKALAKQIVRNAKVPTANSFIMNTGKEKLPKEIQFPVILKPVYEGSSKGIHAKNVIDNEEDLRKIASELLAKYKSGIMVEEYLSGREFTVGVLGAEKKVHVLPPMEIIFRSDLINPIYTFAHKQETNEEVTYEAPAKVDTQLLKEINGVVKKSFEVLGCRDVARFDLRMDSRGHVNFIECNPLPGLTPEWSDLCLIAKSAGINYKSLINEILSPAIRRYKQKVRKETPAFLRD